MLEYKHKSYALCIQNKKSTYHGTLRDENEVITLGERGRERGREYG